MHYSHIELAAVLKAAQGMIAADGRVDENEKQLVAHELINFGVKPDDLKSLFEVANIMEPSLMLATLSQMDNDQKRYVCGFLATIMVVDGDIDDAEMKFWKMVCTFISCPTMSLHEALDYWKNH